MFFWKKKTEPETPTPFLPWKDEHRIGIQQFDLEHQELVALIDQLHTLMVVQRDRVQADRLMDTLLQTIRRHFAHEETLLSELGFPDLEAHAREHSALIEELSNLHRQFKAGTLSALATPHFLQKWLLNHLQTTDRKYVAFMRSKGIR